MAVMPELPEVETIRRDLNKELKGRKILKIKFYDWPKMLRPDPKSLAKAIEGKKIKDFGRRAKLLLMHLDDSGTTVAIHLKLSGQFLLKKASDPKDRFVHIIIQLDKGDELHFNDLRKFGFMKLVRDKAELDTLLSEFGPEPLMKEFTLESFKKIISKSRVKIKTVIMDQKRISGVGNIYADEALWYAKINPERRADRLTDKELKKLYETITLVIKEGIDDRGTSVDQYLDLHAEQGKHASNLKVFRLDKEPCPRCGTTIKKIRVGGRGTHFCPSCQRQ